MVRHIPRPCLNQEGGSNKLSIPTSIDNYHYEADRSDIIVKTAFKFSDLCLHSSDKLKYFNVD